MGHRYYLNGPAPPVQKVTVWFTLATSIVALVLGLAMGFGVARTVSVGWHDEAEEDRGASYRQI